jgi:hypothetical protein
MATAADRPAPDQLWVTDITKHPTPGRVYCCVVLGRVLASGSGLGDRQPPGQRAGYLGLPRFDGQG